MASKAQFVLERPFSRTLSSLAEQKDCRPATPPEEDKGPRVIMKLDTLNTLHVLGPDHYSLTSLCLRSSRLFLPKIDNLFPIVNDLSLELLDHDRVKHLARGTALRHVNPAPALASNSSLPLSFTP